MAEQKEEAYHELFDKLEASEFQHKLLTDSLKHYASVSQLHSIIKFQTPRRAGTSNFIARAAISRAIIEPDSSTAIISPSSRQTEFYMHLLLELLKRLNLTDKIIKQNALSIFLKINKSDRRIYLIGPGGINTLRTTLVLSDSFVAIDLGELLKAAWPRTYILFNPSIDETDPLWKNPTLCITDIKYDEI